MKNLKSFSQHIKEGYSRYPEQDYSALSENDFDPDAVVSRPLEEEEEDDVVDVDIEELPLRPGERVSYPYTEDDKDDIDVNDDVDFDEYGDDEDGVNHDNYENDYDPRYDEDEPIAHHSSDDVDRYLNIKRFSSFARHEGEEFQEEEEELTEEEDTSFNSDADTIVGDIHPNANAAGLANLLDAHGAAIETGDRVNDLHHGGEYVVKELEPFKVIDLSSGRIFGAEHEPDRFEVLDKGHSVDAGHHRAHAMHTLATQYCDDHELCHNELGFKPSSYDHVFHSKALHDKLTGK